MIKVYLKELTNIIEFFNMPSKSLPNPIKFKLLPTYLKLNFKVCIDSSSTFIYNVTKT